jgi:hypothetical protein
MNRRETVMALVVLGAANLPPFAYAQQTGKVWRIGYLGPSAEDAHYGPV